MENEDKGLVTMRLSRGVLSIALLLLFLCQKQPMAAGPGALRSGLWVRMTPASERVNRQAAGAAALLDLASNYGERGELAQAEMRSASSPGLRRS